jgi:hypothetical protein
MEDGTGSSGSGSDSGAAGAGAGAAGRRQRAGAIRAGNRQQEAIINYSWFCVYLVLYQSRR